MHTYMSWLIWLTLLGLGTLAGDSLAAVVPTPPSIAASAYLLEDYHTGRVLSEKNADERMEPASLTKMMTTYVVFSEMAEGKFGLSDTVPISKKAWQMPGSRMFVEVDTRVPVESLLKGVIIQSGNDASVALAEFVAGDETAFAGLMNQYAARLGMTGSHFTNASGLPHEEHYTTARDMAKVATALIRDFPQFYPWHSQKSFEYNDIVQHNRNKLLWRDETVDGLKTGHTQSAGYCLVASAERGDMRLISVILGSESERVRAEQSAALLTYGFQFFETHRVYEALDPITRVRVWQGNVQQLGVGVSEDLYVTVPRGQYDKLDVAMEVDAPIVAPVEEGETRGVVRIALRDEPIAERSLVALQSVEPGSIWQRVTDYVRLLFN